MENSVEEYNTNQLSSESLKATNDQQKQEIACLTEDMKLIKSSVADLQVEAKAIYSEKKISVSKVRKLQGKTNTVTEDMSTRIKVEKAEEKIQQLKSVISENSRIIDNKCPDNVEILREKMIWNVN